MPLHLVVWDLKFGVSDCEGRVRGACIPWYLMKKIDISVERVGRLLDGDWVMILKCRFFVSYQCAGANHSVPAWILA